MSGFRNFFISSVPGAGQNPLSEINETQKWDVVLFVGNYDPITKDEYERIKQFVSKIVKGEQANKFSHDVDLGVLVNEQLDEESYFEEKHNTSLSFEDKEFITGKLFGLKIFPVNFKQLMWLTLGQSDKESSENAKEKINKITSKIQQSFEKANILIVLRESDNHSLEALGEIIHKFSDNNLNIGFMVYKHEPVKNAMLDNIPMTGEIIKAVCLMDFERPTPEDLKSFSYKYKLSKYLDTIRTIHFKVQGAKYLLPFTSLFPDLVIYGDEEFEDKKNNYIFVMEVLKKMYLGDDYENKLEAQINDNKKKVIPNSGQAGGSDSSAPGGSAGASTSPESSENTPDNDAEPPPGGTPPGNSDVEAPI